MYMRNLFLEPINGIVAVVNIKGNKLHDLHIIFFVFVCLVFSFLIFDFLTFPLFVCFLFYYCAVVVVVVLQKKSFKFN